MLSVNVNLFAFNSSGRSALPLEQAVKAFFSALSHWDISPQCTFSRSYTIVKTWGGNSWLSAEPLSLLNLVLWISVCQFACVFVRDKEWSGVACLQAPLSAVNVSTGLCLALMYACSSILHVCVHQSSLWDTPVDQYCTCRSNLRSHTHTYTDTLLPHHLCWTASGRALCCWYG